jgi:hypothetical protein
MHLSSREHVSNPLSPTPLSLDAIGAGSTNGADLLPLAKAAAAHAKK